MITPDDHHTKPESEQTAAREIFAHALLEFRQLDTPEVQEARIRSAMSAIAEQSAARVLKFSSSGVRAMKFLLSAAASIVLVGLVSVYFSSTEPKALALVQASIDAAQKVPVRRYQVRPSDSLSTLPTNPQATLDVGAERHFVIRARTERGDQIAGGRGDSGEWAIRPDGGIETSEPRPWWPRWIFLLDESLTGSPDDILAYVKRDYEARLDATEVIDGVKCRHIHATRREQPLVSVPSGSPEPQSGEKEAVSGQDDVPSPEENGISTPTRGSRPEGPGLPNGGRPGGPRGPAGVGGPGGPGVAPELVPFLEGLGGPGREGGGERGEPGMDEPGGRPRVGGPGFGPPRRGPFGGRGFVPPDFVPRGEMRARLPSSIDIWIDESSLMVRRLDIRWNGPRPQPPVRDGMPRHPMPPARIEFRMTEAPAATDAGAWFEPQTHQ